MARMSISLPDTLHRDLEHEARRRGVSMADVAREAVAAYVSGPRGRLSFTAFGEGPGDSVGDSVGDAGEQLSDAIDEREREGRVGERDEPSV